MHKVRHYKKCIREGIKEIVDNKLKNKSDMESLIRWSAWVHADAKRVLKEWNKS